MPARHYLSACLCFKNAATYLAEWLAFHSVVGVEHFYLIDNDSADDYGPIIEPYLRRGTATLIRFPGRGIQRWAYEYCLARFGRTTRWMMFCDDDEFLFPCADVSLARALQSYEQHAGVAISWMLFGSAGHQTRPPGLVIANYTRRSVLPDQHVKCVVDPQRVHGCVLVGHQFTPVPGYLIVDEHHEPMSGPFRAPTCDVLRINHYLTKSLTELVYRRSQIQVNTGEISPLTIPQWLRLEAGWNAVEDTTVRRYLSRIQDHMASYHVAAD